MPERHAGGSSSSGGSNRSSSSSSSSSSHSSYRSSYSNRNYNNEPTSPEEQQFWLIVGGIVLVIAAVIWIGSQISDANKRNTDANATKTTEAITLKDLAQMRAALDPRLPDWRQVNDLAVHHISASDAGFGPGDNTKEVVYGYCQEKQFYVYVLESSRPAVGWLADTEGYAYVPDSYSPSACIPQYWRVVSADYAAPGWYFVTLGTLDATSVAVRLSLTPPPTATPVPTRADVF